MTASPAGRGRLSRGAVIGISAESDPRDDPAMRSCLAAALVSLAMLLPASSARGQECAPGDRQVRSLQFVGNRTFPDDKLSLYVTTTPSSFARRHFRIIGTKRCYPVNGLGPDVANLKAYYGANGFYDARVDTVVRSVGKDVVDVTFRIDEGPPMRLDSLEITGLDSVRDSARVTRDLALMVGGRFGRLQMGTDIDSITSRLRNVGYPRAEVFSAYNTHTQTHTAEVRLDVETGPLSRIGAIHVNSTSQSGGPPEIDTAVVRHLLGFSSGDRYSDDALLNGQRNLYNLGTYRHVGVEPDSANRADSLTDVNVDLREDYLHQYDIDEGWATLDCFRVNAQYTDKNFLEQARRLDLTARLSKIGYGSPLASAETRNLCYRPQLDQDSIASSKVNYRLSAAMRQPTLFGTHWVPAYSAYTERRGEYRAYLRTTYVGGDASATRNIGVGMPLRVGYTMELGKTEAQPATLCAVFFRCTVEEQDALERTLRLAVASVSLQRNRVDSPIEPTTGYTIGGELRGAAKFIGSDPSEQFAKGTVDMAGYKALGRSVVAAFRISGGLVRAPSDTNGSRVPPQERLYAGGSNSVRGFGQNLMGPLVYLMDSTKFTVTHIDSVTSVYVLKQADEQPSKTPIPVGGNAVFVFNAELRVRDPFFPDLIEYVPFVDGGQVWSQIPNVKNFHLLKSVLVTPGLGIRISTPVGPIQLSLGYNSHPNQPGPAYFAAPVDAAGHAPLICVTPPGQPTVPVVVHGDGTLTQARCPATYAPASPSGFFQRLTKILSIGTSF